jgi:hypothetical protein
MANNVMNRNYGEKRNILLLEHVHLEDQKGDDRISFFV